MMTSLDNILNEIRSSCSAIESNIFTMRKYLMKKKESNIETNICLD